ncbi:hypothetical protein [Streptomyces sp. NEAU-174]|uniref:hypothetical protein n=1 Tax=Streptomyces sp. NEAU-174 TaxID=3458254 RepID=UPI004044843B
MSDNDKTYGFDSNDAAPHWRPAIGDVLSQLDRVLDEDSTPESEEGLTELMAWMSEDPASDSSTLEAHEYFPRMQKILIAGGVRAGAVDFIRSLTDVHESRVPESCPGTLVRQWHTVYRGCITLPTDELNCLAPAERTPTLSWDSLVRGSVGAVVVADPASLEDAFAPLDYLEAARMTYVVAVNRDEKTCKYSETEIRQALDLSSDVPVTFGKLPHFNSARATLILLLEACLRKEEGKLCSEDEELTALVLLTQLEALLR